MKRTKSERGRERAKQRARRRRPYVRLYSCAPDARAYGFEDDPDEFAVQFPAAPEIVQVIEDDPLKKELEEC